MRDIPIIFSGPMVRALLDGRKTMTRRLGMSPLRKVEPGDRLWVRENVRLCSAGPGDEVEIAYAADGDMPMVHSFSMPGNKLKRTGITPCIHMPRAISRLTLIVEIVKVERLQDISEDDAKREGAHREFRAVLSDPHGAPDHRIALSYRGGFANIWCGLHKYPNDWPRNPEVVAIGYRVIKDNIDRVEHGL